MATEPTTRNIVVAIDFAEMTDAVLTAAAAEASLRRPAVVHVACAIDPKNELIVDGRVLVSELDQLEEAIRARAEEQLTAAALDYRVHAMLGRPAPMIADLAREQRAELVVIGRHSRSRKVEVGSVPAELLNLAHCSVLVVQPPDYGDTPPVL